jgi:nicotinamidase-related amidase
MEDPLAIPEMRLKSALLVIDMKNKVVAAACNRDAVISNFVRFIPKARDEAVPVVWVRHSDEDLVR